jgi:Rieske 2Fe-2S family protein
MPLAYNERVGQQMIASTRTPTIPMSISTASETSPHESRPDGNATLAALLAQQPVGHALLQGFYRDAEVFEREMERIFLRAWLYVGHQSEIPETGDYFLFEIAGESVIVVRSSASEVSALVNVCRHRGSRVCLERSGRAKLFACSYHGWTYDLDGRLRGAGYMTGAFDKSDYGLKRLSVRVFHGLIFINFAKEPVDFTPFERDLNEALAPYQLDRAKVARRASYPLAANWKLAVENYCECYHCAPAHPDYTRMHGRAFPNEQMAALLEQVMARAESVGLTRHYVNQSWQPGAPVGIDRGFDRYPLLGGCLTGSRDGRPVAPLLGRLTGYDGGATDLHLGPTTFALAYCDHVVLYRFSPLTVDTCECEVTWLVNGAAEEGRDYRLDDLIWLWDVTTVADKSIIEHNQQGVNSRFYEPGPYSEMETFTRRFTDWYLAVMRAA